MEKTQIAMWLQSNAKFFPEGQSLYLQGKLEKLSDDQFMQVSTLDFKDPTVMTIISVFLGGFGVDRFMLGETGMGVLKLLTAGCCGILWLIDLFSTAKKTKEFNLNKFNNAIVAIGV